MLIIGLIVFALVVVGGAAAYAAAMFDAIARASGQQPEELEYQDAISESAATKRRAASS